LHTHQRTHTHTRTHARAHAHTQARWGPALLTKLQFMISEQNRQYSNIDKQDRHQEAAAAEAGKIPSLDVRYDGVWDSLLRRYRNTCVSYRRAPRLRLLKLRGILSASLFQENASCRGAIAYILPLFPCTRPTIQSLNGVLLGKEREFTYSTSKPVTARDDCLCGKHAALSRRAFSFFKVANQASLLFHRV